MNRRGPRMLPRPHNHVKTQLEAPPKNQETALIRNGNCQHSHLRLPSPRTVRNISLTPYLVYGYFFPQKPRESHFLDMGMNSEVLKPCPVLQTPAFRICMSFLSFFITDYFGLSITPLPHTLFCNLPQLYCGHN